MAKKAKTAAQKLSLCPTEVKNKALINMADAIEKNTEYILTENLIDYQMAKSRKVRSSLLDRLLLNQNRIEDMAEGRSVNYKSCKEGTYIDVDKCLYINDGMQTTDVNGLNSIANTLELDTKNLIDYSNQLPQNKGFQILNDDDLKKSCIYSINFNIGYNPIPIISLGEIGYSLLIQNPYLNRR